MLQVNVCPICGGNGGLVKLDVNGDVTSYKCQYCGNLFEENKVELYAEQLQSFLDEKNQEEVASLRNLLYEEVYNKKYINSDRIISLCRSIREHLPDDFLAKFFEAANSKNEEETCKLLCNFDVEEYDYAVDYILDFMLKSLEHAYILPLNNLIENAYKNTDLEKYNRYATLLSKEAEKLEAGIYTPNLPRDVFVCYASKDMPKVMALVNALESEGISCFVAARNLRHGVGAVQNYNEAIQTAIDYSKIVVFVSSSNSRKLSCDATKFELPYIRKGDIANAPAEYRQNYEKMPSQYKKPRVEYLLNNYSKSSSEKIAGDFFLGNEWCLSQESVVTRVVDILTNGWYTPKDAPADNRSGMGSASAQYSQGNSADVEKAQKLLVRTKTYIAVADWYTALEYANEVLELDPTNSDGALFALLASAHCSDVKQLATCKPVDVDGVAVEWEKSTAYKQAMEICNKEIKDLIGQALREKREMREKAKAEKERMEQAAAAVSTLNQEGNSDIQQTDASTSSKKLFSWLTVSSVTWIVFFIIIVSILFSEDQAWVLLVFPIGLIIGVIATNRVYRELKEGRGKEYSTLFEKPITYYVLSIVTAFILNIVLWVNVIVKKNKGSH